MSTLAPAPPLRPGEIRQAPGQRFGRQLGIAGGWFVISYLLAMLAWVFIPAVVMGWKPMVILSGSMAPVIVPGDVVLIDPDSANRSPGSVLAFVSDGGVIIVHRLDEEIEDGIYVTKGDANPDADSTPVPESAVLGQGRLLVPIIGYPKVWVHDGAAALIAAVFGLILVLIRTKRATLIVAGGVLVGWLVFSAMAAFADSTASGASSFGAGTVLPPTNLTGSCGGGIGVGNPVPVDLNWTASPTLGVSGYEILYDAPPAGGGYSQIGSVPAPQTSFTHTIPDTELALGEPHTYAVRAVVDSWVSADSVPETVTVTAVALLYVCA